MCHTLYSTGCVMPSVGLSSFLRSKLALQHRLCHALCRVVLFPEKQACKPRQVSTGQETCLKATKLGGSGEEPHGSPVADEGALGLAVPDVPQPQGVVARSGGQVVRIRMPLDDIHIRVVPCIKSARHDPLMISPVV